MFRSKIVHYWYVVAEIAFVDGTITKVGSVCCATLDQEHMQNCSGSESYNVVQELNQMIAKFRTDIAYPKDKPVSNIFILSVNKLL